MGRKIVQIHLIKSMYSTFCAMLRVILRIYISILIWKKWPIFYLHFFSTLRFQLSSSFLIFHCSIEIETRNERCVRLKGIEKTKNGVPRSEVSSCKQELYALTEHAREKLLTRFSAAKEISQQIRLHGEIVSSRSILFKPGH